MSSRFAVSRETRVQALLSQLIPSVAGVAPEDEMGNFDIALEWAVGNFAVHQFLDTDCAVVQREYDQTCEKLRVHSRLDSAEVLRGLVEQLVRPRGLSGGGTWRFPTAQVLDLPHGILSLLFHLSNSPTQSVHRPVGLKQLQQHRMVEHGTRSPQQAETSDDDTSSDSSGDAYDSEASLSDWSEDDDDDDDGGSSGSSRPLEDPDQSGGNTASQRSRAKETSATEQKRLSTRMAESLILSASYASGSDGGLALSACGLARAVERHHASTQAYDAPWQYSTTTELVLVREISLMLLGEPGDVFQCSLGPATAAQTFQMLPVQVVHLSPDALQRLVAPLIATSNDLLRIRHFCGQHSGATQATGATCATVQAFASAMAQILDESVAWVRQLERRMLSETRSENRATDGSLLRLCRSARPLISTVAAIVRIIITAIPFAWKGAMGSSDRGVLSASEMATRVLDALLSSMREGDGLATKITIATATPATAARENSEVEFSLASRLLLETVRPQIMMLGTWIQDGRLHDIHGEFFIRGSDAAADPRAARFWSRAYSLRSRPAATKAGSSSSVANELSCVPLLFKSVALEVLACGKSSIVCAEDSDGVFETHLAADCPRATDDLYRSCVRDLVQKLATQSNQSTQVAFGQATSQMMWDACLTSTIRSRCAAQTKRLATKLTAQHRLQTYMDVLRACFFMGDGHFTSEVCRYCYRKVDHRESWDDQHTLEALFDEVLQQHDRRDGWDLRSGRGLGVSVEVERKPRLAEAQDGRSDVHALDDLFIGFRTPWPISIIIDDECIDRCNRILRLLLQVKRAKHTLDGLFVRQAMGEASSEGLAFIQEGLLFQAELMHFVNNLHYYLMNRVAYGGWASFRAQLHRAADLDSIANLYRRYLIGVHDQCLLSPKAKYVMDAILKILDIVLEMKNQALSADGGGGGSDRVGDRDDDSGCTEAYLRLQRQRSRFRRLHKLLLQVLSTVVSQGSDTGHFEDLAMRLDFNRFYASVDSN